MSEKEHAYELIFSILESGARVLRRIENGRVADGEYAAYELMKKAYELHRMCCHDVL